MNNSADLHEHSLFGIGVDGALAEFWSNRCRFLLNCTMVVMGPKPADTADQDLFRAELVNLTDQRHELVRLAALTDWDAFSQHWSPPSSTLGAGKFLICRDWHCDPQTTS